MAIRLSQGVCLVRVDCGNGRAEGMASVLSVGVSMEHGVWRYS